MQRIKEASDVDKLQAVDDIKTIREIMERSTKYTHFTGLSGVISGVAALVGTYITWWIYCSSLTVVMQGVWSLVTWVAVFVFAIGQDFLLAQRRAIQQGTTMRTPATFLVLRAAFPGVFVAFVISLVALLEGSVDAIPGVLALGYGAALCSAGMFSTREVGIYGVVQLVTGAASLLFMLALPLDVPLAPYSIGTLALCFGVYQIIFGLVIAARYGR